MPNAIIPKLCHKCKRKKPLSQFYLDKGHYSSPCKQCRNVQHQQYKRTEKGQLTERKYQCGELGRKAQKRARQKFQYTNKYKISYLRYCRKYPERRRAKGAVNNAIQRGKLPRPDSKQCSLCPKQAEQYHHHLGYDRKHWLDVIPACHSCHVILHHPSLHTMS